MSTFIEKVNDLAIRVGQEFNDLYTTDNTFIRNQTSVTQTGGFKINGTATVSDLTTTGLVGSVSYGTKRIPFLDQTTGVFGSHSGLSSDGAGSLAAASVNVHGAGGLSVTNASRHYADVFLSASGGQTTVGAPTIPEASSILTTVSTTKGVLFSKMTTTQKNAISSPATGLLVFDTTTNKYEYFDGSVWAAMGSGGGSGITGLVAGYLTIATSATTIGNSIVSEGSGNINIAGNLGVGSGVIPAASAIFEAGGTTKGFLIPRLTTTQQNLISSPATGLIIYNTTMNAIRYFNGTAWVSNTSSVSTGLTPGTIPIADSTGNLVDSVLYNAGTSYRLIKPYFVIQDTSPGVQFWKDATPSKAAQIGFNNLSTDGLTFEIYDGSGWGTALSMTGNRSIGIGTNTTNASSILDITSTTKGVLLPRMTTTQRNAISSPATGLIIFNTTTGVFEFYNGTSWNSIGGWGLTGNAGTVAGTNFIGTTDNVDFVVKVNNAQYGRFFTGGGVTLGQGATDVMGNGVVHGVLAQNNGWLGIAIGYAANNNGSEGVAIGREAYTVAGAVSLGYGSRAEGQYSGAFGLLSKSTHTGAWTFTDGHLYSNWATSDAANQAKFVFANGVKFSTNNTTVDFISDSTSTRIAGILDTITNTDLYIKRNNVQVAKFTSEEVMIGRAADASGQSVAVGRLSNSFGDENVALGSRTVSTGALTSISIGGYSTSATASYAIAIGKLAVASHAGSFVMHDNQPEAMFASDRVGQWKTKYSGGYDFYLGTTSPFLGMQLSSTGSLGIMTGGSIAASAIFQTDSTTKGVLIPRMTTTQQNAISSPATGLSLYNTTLNLNSIYNGTVWTQDWGTRGNAIVSGDFIGTTNGQDLVFKVNNVRSGLINVSGLNTYFGYNSSGTNTGTYNTFIGYQAGYGSGTSIGSAAVGVGYNALAALQGGDYNVAFGYQAAQATTNGSYNVAFGSRTLLSNTSGSNNIAIGGNSLLSNIAGTSNIAIGIGAIQTANANGNIGIGSNALNLAAGSFNVALGHQAGQSVTSGGANIVIGANQELAYNTGSNQMNIGGLLFGVSMSGSVSSPAGQLGILTNAPTAGYAVDVNGDIKGTRINIGTITSSGTATAAIGDSGSITASSTYSWIMGGYSNTISGGYISSISGGASNTVYGTNNNVAGSVGGLIAAGANNNSIIGGRSNQIFAGTSTGNDIVGSTSSFVDANKNYNKIFATGAFAQNHGGMYLSDNAATGGGYLSATADDQFVARFLNGYVFKTANNVNVMQISSAGAVAIGSSTADASSILDLQSTTKGALLPKMTTTQQNAISSPATGLLIFNTTTNTLRYYTGSAWADVSAVSTTTDWSTTGNTALTTDYIGTNNNVNLVFARGGLTAGILGTLNVALGVGSNPFNSGSRVTAIGVETFTNGGNDNTGLGYRAGYSQTAGSNNIAIGSNVDVPSLTGSNQMNIGNVIYGLAMNGGGVTPAVPAGRIGIGTSAPDASAILHLASTTQGFIMPVMTDAQKVSISSPANGLLVYNTDTKMVENNDAGVWKNKMFQPIISVSSAYTPTNQDYTINCVTASFTVTLPVCSGALTGRIFVIKNSSPGGPITVAGAGADLIDGAPTKVIPVIYDSITVQCTGNEWIII